MIPYAASRVGFPHNIRVVNRNAICDQYNGLLT